MKILIGHNHYQIPGGEDAVVQAEATLLRDRGEDVHLYERSNEELNSYSALQKIKFLTEMGNSSRTYQDLRKVIQKFQPDVVHFHNIFYTMTPSAYKACKDEGVPIVQSLHNFRLSCVNGLFYRDNHVCEDCLNKSLWEGVKNRCFKGSLAMSAYLAHVIKKNWQNKAWVNDVDMYIMASEFGRQKMILAGLPAEKMMVKPNFVHPDLGENYQGGDYGLYVGRLSEEKGVDVLLKAWQQIKNHPLRIIGDGPLADKFKSEKVENVEFLGYVDQKEREKQMRGAKFLIVPSQCYENFPRIVAEGFALGLPVIASRLGSLQEIIEDQKSGLLFEADNAEDLSEKIAWAFMHEDTLKNMGRQARLIYEQKYAAQKNYEQLIEIYKKVLGLVSYV